MCSIKNLFGASWAYVKELRQLLVSFPLEAHMVNQFAALLVFLNPFDLSHIIFL